MQQQAALVGDGVNLKVMSANQNDSKQAEDIMLAATQDNTTVGILTVDGNNGTLCDSINKVLDLLILLSFHLILKERHVPRNRF